MPNIKSAKKRVITSRKKNANNTLGKSSMKTAIKKSEKAIKTQDKALAEENLKVAINSKQTVIYIDCYETPIVITKQKLSQINKR